MKRTLLFLALCFACLPASALIPVAASNVTDVFGNPYPSARLCFAPVNAADQLTGWRNGTAQALAVEKCGTVTNGVLQASLNVVGNISGTFYHIRTRASNSNTVLRDFGMTSITASWTLDTYDPSMAVLPTAAVSTTGSIANNVEIPNVNGYLFSSTSSPLGTPDTGVSRDSPGVVDVGNGTPGNAGGALQAAVLNASAALSLLSGTNTTFQFSGSALFMYSGARLAWTPNANVLGSSDVGITRLGPATLGIGSGAANDTTGQLSAAQYSVMDSGASRISFIGPVSNAMFMSSGTRLAWTPNTTTAGSTDTALSRCGIAIVCVGNGGAGDASAAIHIGAISVGGDTAFTSAPRMLWNSFQGTATASWPYSNPLASFVPDKPITVTRMSASTGAAVTNCSVSPAVSISDNTAAVTLTFANGSGSFVALDSGAVSQNFASGVALRIVESPGTCTTAPSINNITVEYKMQ